jgi:hypothetical protein
MAKVARPSARQTEFSALAFNRGGDSAVHGLRLIQTTIGTRSSVAFACATKDQGMIAHL